MRKNSMDPTNETELNRKSWDCATRIHNSAKGNFANSIQSRPKSILFNEVADLIPDTNGKTVIQPFCNDGRELLSIVGTKGKGVGIDFSSNAILFAEELNSVLKYNCAFYCEEVLSWLHAQSAMVADVCFTSLGSIWWIKDLRDYFISIYRIISKNGQYILWDFHPFVHILNDDLEIKYSYPLPFIKRFHESGIIDYVTDPNTYYLAARQKIRDEQFVNPFPVYDYIWGLAEIVDAASAAGWRIGQMKEYPHILGEKYLAGLVRKGKFLYTTKPGAPLLPLTFSLVLLKT